MVYIFAFALCMLLMFVVEPKCDKRVIRIFSILILIYLAFLAGTRDQLGGQDYSIYKGYYNSLPDFSTIVKQIIHGENVIELYNYEIGYTLYNALIKSFGFNFYGFTLINAFIFVALFYVGIKRYTDRFSLVLFVFLYKIYFYNMFISMRQSVTLVIFLVIMRYIEEKKPLRYMAGCLLAFFFHTGAIILFPLYLIAHVDITKRRVKILNIIFIPTLIISYLNLPVLNFLIDIIEDIQYGFAGEKAVSWVSSMSEKLSLFHTLEFFLIMIVLYVFYDYIVQADKHAKFVIKLYLCLLPIMTLLRSYILFTREKDYFVLMYGLILVYLCKGLERTKEYRHWWFRKNVNFFVAAVCIFGFCKFLIQFDGGVFIEYHSYLERKETIFVEERNKDEENNDIYSYLQSQE